MVKSSVRHQQVPVFNCLTTHRLVRCKLSRPSAVRKLNRPICDLVEQIVYNKTFIDHIAVKIEAHMREKSLKYLYFAAPPQVAIELLFVSVKWIQKRWNQKFKIYENFFN